jgi:hypothetical protein
MPIPKHYITLFLLQLSTHLYAQNTHFYIASIIDQRENRSNVGQIFNTSQTLIPFKLSEPLPKYLTNIWHISDTHTLESYPIIATINTFKITESLIRNEKINGKIIISLTFSWMRDSTEVMLVPYKSAFQYTRSANKIVDYEAIISKSIANVMPYLSQWFLQNLDKNPALAKGVRVNIQPNYTDNTPESDTVFHAERAIQWTDFAEKKSAPNTLKPFNSRFVATIYTTFLYEAPTHIRNGYIEIDLRIKVFMQKSMSWLLPEAKNAYALNHEQLHFDITRLVSERYKSHILGQSLSVEDYDSQLQLAYIDFFREMNKFQDQYDAETEHGLNKAAQAEWQERIKKQLKIYE